MLGTDSGWDPHGRPAEGQGPLVWLFACHPESYLSSGGLVCWTLSLALQPRSIARSSGKTCELSLFFPRKEEGSTGRGRALLSLVWLVRGGSEHIIMLRWQSWSLWVEFSVLGCLAVGGSPRPWHLSSSVVPGPQAKKGRCEHGPRALSQDWESLGGRPSNHLSID